MNVFINKINQEGTILSISKNGKIAINLPLGKMYFDLEDIEIIEKKINTKQKNRKIDYSSKKDFIPQKISTEINVIGQNIDEACFLIDKYLDNCVLNHLESVRIIHGKGTGTLRNGIHKYLKTHPHVKSYRIGTYGEGEMGVTIVEIC